jgi:hypothetical protein
MSRKMLFALAGVAVLLAGSPAWKADAAAPIGVSSLPPLVHSSSPVETARCVCGPADAPAAVHGAVAIGDGAQAGAGVLVVAIGAAVFAFAVGSI